MKTPEEIQKLKDNWRHDPIWDIWETEGFEEHKQELREYQQNMEKKWEEERLIKLKESAAKMGIPDNLILAKYIIALEYEIEQLKSDMIAVGEHL